MTPDAQPDAIQRARHQLAMILKDGSLLSISEELALCWTSLKADPTVSDPEAQMAELGDWYAGQIKAAISQEIAHSPVGQAPTNADDDFWEEAEAPGIPPIDSPRVAFAPHPGQIIMFIDELEVYAVPCPDPNHPPSHQAVYDSYVAQSGETADA